jgi:hypothetical protein
MCVSDRFSASAKVNGTIAFFALIGAEMQAFPGMARRKKR